MKIVGFLQAVFSEILCEISPFAFFFRQKQLKKPNIPSKKTVTFCENCRSIIRVFALKLSKISPFALFLVKKNNTKKRYTFQINHSIIWKLSSYYKGFFLKMSEISPFALPTATSKLILLKSGISNLPPPKMFWWVVASHNFQTPEKKDLQSDSNLIVLWLGG